MQVVFAGHQQIDVARQRKMLKPIVEDVNGRAQTAFGQAAGQKAIGADGDDDAGDGARQHQRLVAGRIDAGQHARPVGHHGHAGRRDAPAVAAREDRRPFTARDEQPGEVFDDRRLAGAADAQVADADHRTLEPVLPLRMRARTTRAATPAAAP